jgi:hypothetical protein
LAVPALDDLGIEPSFLNFLSSIGPPDCLDRRHGRASDAVDRRYARANRHAVDMHRAGAAKSHPTTEFGARQADDIAQDPEKRGVIVGIDRMLHTVHVDGEGHLWIPHVRCDLRKLYRIDYTVSSDGSRWARVPRET